MLDWFSNEESGRRRKTIPKSVKISVWNKYIGATKAEGKCYVCRRTIHITDFDVGHNKARARGGSDNISNLRCICRTCNTSMGTTSIESFKAKHFSRTKKATESRVKSKKTKSKRRTSERGPFWPWF